MSDCALTDVAWLRYAETMTMTQRKPYADPTTGEWVGEHTWFEASDGEVHHSTEWFASWADAEHFVRTGQRPAPDQCSEITGKGARCSRKGRYVVVKTGALVCLTHGRELAGYGLRVEEAQ